MSVLFLIINILFLTLTSTSIAQHQNGIASCPLDFSILNKFGVESSRSDVDLSMECQYIRQGLRLVQSHYLQLNGSFLPPLESAESCWIAYQSLIKQYRPNLDIRKSCGFQTSWISQGCMNITTKTQFESIIPNTTLDDVVANCNHSLENNAPCASCTTSMSRLQVYLMGPSVGNVSDCTAYPSIYAAAFANHFGPTDRGTAECLFFLDLTSENSGKEKKRNVVILVVLIGSGIGLLAIVVGAWFLCHRHERLEKKEKEDELRRAEKGLASALESFRESTTLVKFPIEGVKKATGNFSRENLIGRGGYGNVYKGVLPDGSEVAFKRFNNCSAIGEANFAHEVEVIASVRHVNLVALRGYCIGTTSFEGHQRIIKGRALDVIEEGMPELGTPEVLEKYVVVAVLCSHPQLYARPTMDQVVKMLETDASVPSIPERPIPLVSEMDDIERSVSSSGSGHLATSSGYQPFTFESDFPSSHNEDG
ncbi:LRR receptor-like serine/threonine-protein kinase RKF3 [Tripterygium wilfordii]|uniref:LRR receptor-like serine/threonine-protein kinase RKF3 n=1 Tax=Tripterygium wilfordii TaxID=458696 RepID=A0A7J7CBN0_TRIWF|nr:LRR receptor-like serine/threonine-protein kinase RKF3 [Tripterygium wilfordii]